MSDGERSLESEVDSESSINIVDSSPNEDIQSGPETNQRSVRRGAVDPDDSDSGDDFQQQPQKRRKTEENDDKDVQENENLNISSEDVSA